MGHFIENLSDDEPLEVLEIFRAGKKAHWLCGRRDNVPVANMFYSRRVPRLLSLPMDGRDAEASGSRPPVPA
jgi:hypothetical protein